MTGPLLAGAIAAASMTAALVYGFVAGEGWSELAEAMRMPWVRVTTIDVYAGLLLVAAWVWHRERSRAAATAWTIALVLTGNLGAGIYVVLAAAGADGDWDRFWRGRRA